MKPTTYAKGKKLFDSVFSLFIRLRDSNKEGVGRCITCGAFKSIQNVDAGHYKKRQLMNLRYNEHNVNSQCKSCNGFYQGRDDLFREGIAHKFGVEAVHKLDLLEAINKRGSTKHYLFEFVVGVEMYTKKCMYLLKKKDLPIREWSVKKLKKHLGVKWFNEITE